MSEVLTYLLSTGQKFINSLPGAVAQGIIWGIMALGTYFTFRLLKFADLSVDGSFATGGAVCIILILNNFNPWLALVLSMVAGILCGVVTGILHTVLGIPDILAGILTQIALYSINLLILGKANQSINVNKVALAISSRNIWLTIGIGAVMVIFLVSILYCFLGTETGAAFRATGLNPEMSKANGINIGFMKVVGLGISNGVVALAGGLIAQYQGFADINMGRGAIVIGLAAIIIGEVFFTGSFGKHVNFYGRLLFIVLGGIIYFIVYNFVIALGVPTDFMKLFTAIVVAVFLAIPYLKKITKTSFFSLKRRSQKKLKGESKDA